MFYILAKLVVRPFFGLMFRPTVTGRDNVPADGPVILASNHLSFIDSFVIPVVAPRPVSYLAKAEYWRGCGLRGWFTRNLFSTLGALPVERGSSRSAQDSLDAALGLLNRGGAFGIYPEGTRSRTGSLARGKTGVAWLAMAADCPIVPVAVHGTDKIQPVGSRMLRPAKVRVSFGAPLVFPAESLPRSSGRARREITDRVMLAIEELSGQERDGW